MLVWKNYGVPTVRVYPAYRGDVEVTKDGRIEKITWTRKRIRGKPFVLSGGHLYYEPQQEFLSQIFSRIEPHSYEIEVLSSGVRYTVNSMVIEMNSKRITVNGVEVFSVDDVFSISPAFTCPQEDIVLSGCKDPIKEEQYYVIEPADYVIFPYAYRVSKKVYMSGHVTVKTPEGKKGVPYIPAFIKRYKIFDPHYLITINAKNPDVQRTPFIIPGVETWTKNGLFYYESPEEWYGLLENGAYVARRGDEWVISEEDQRGFGKTVYHTNEGDYYINPELPTGQKVLFMKYSKSTTRLYGIVTPEGLFVIDVPTKRIYEGEPISALEKGVKIVGTFIVFPVYIRLSSSSVSYNGIHSKTTITMTIDGHVIAKDLLATNLSTNTGEKIFKKLKITSDDHDILMNYGLSEL